MAKVVRFHQTAGPENLRMSRRRPGNRIGAR